MGRLGLKTEEFWGADRRRTEDAVLEPVFAGEDPRCLIVDAPSVVRIDHRETLPLLGYFVRSDRDERTLRFNHAAVGVAVDLDTGDVHVHPLFDRGKMRAETPKPQLPALSWIRQITFFDPDLRDALGLPWQPGRYSVSVLAREFLSNRVQVELEDPTRFQDPAVKEFVEAKREVALAPPVTPPHPVEDEDGKRPSLPRYLASEDSPEVPAEQGIILSGERVSVLTPGRQCVVHGSFRLTLLERQMVRPDPTTARQPDVGDPAATAVVPITIVGTGSETRGPFVFRLQVPVYDAISEGGEVTGCFSVDLFEFASGPLPRRPQTCFLTAFNGPLASDGPLAMAFVSAQMLRQG